MAHRGPSGYPPAYDESSPTHAMDSRRGSSPAIPRLPSLHFSNASTRRGSRSSQSSQAGVDTTQQGEGEIAYPPEYDRPMRSRAELKEQRERLASVYDDVKQELASGKAADMEHFMLRIRAMVQHVDKSAEHPELPVRFSSDLGVELLQADLALSCRVTIYLGRGSSTRCGPRSETAVSPNAVARCFASAFESSGSAELITTRLQQRKRL